LNRKRNNEFLLAGNLHEQGLIHTRLARIAGGDEAAYRRTAFERFGESLAISRRINNEAGAADSLGELGKLRMEAGQMSEAIAAFNEALEIFTRLGNPAKVGLTLEMLGIIHERQGHYTAALEKYRQARALLQKYGSPQNVAIVENHIARVTQKMKEEG
jgi:tetratricopeptide (TPR) repeat protein